MRTLKVYDYKMAGCNRTFPWFILERGTMPLGRDQTINFTRVLIGAYRLQFFPDNARSAQPRSSPWL